MNKNDLRYSLSSEQYLEKNHVMVYLEDAIAQLLEHRDDTSKFSSSKFFSSYFVSVREGTHVLLREYSFIHATPHNRSSFVRMCWKTLSNVARKIELMNMYEYHSLLCLICPDLPLSIVQQSARIVLVDDSLECLMPFTDFIYAFQLQLCYEEFLNKCHEAFQALQLNRTSNLEAVVVPTSEGRPHTASVAHGNNGGSSTDGVDSMVYYRSVVGICEKMDTAIPADIVKNILLSTPRTSFYGFLNCLAKSSAVNDHIGKLPQRSELLTTYEPEMTTKTSTPPPTNEVGAGEIEQRPMSGAESRSSSLSVRMRSNTRPLSGSLRHTPNTPSILPPANPRQRRPLQRAQVTPKNRCRLSDSDDDGVDDEDDDDRSLT